MRARVFACVLAGALAAPWPAHGWGLATHRMIAEEAIATLPEPLRGWFERHREDVSDGSVEPDTVLRERGGREEAVRHFIDLDLYGEPPFAELPRDHGAAVARYGKEKVLERGIVPWTIEEKHERLAREMHGGRWRDALRTAAHAAHYVADATMPLHTTVDYDGKLGGLPGIHKAVEHGVVDERLPRYRDQVRRGIGGPRPAYDRDAIFAILRESYDALAELTSADRGARGAGDVGSAAYAEIVDRRARRMLVARLTRAVEFLGSFWLSAWEDAGRPPPPRD